VQVQADLREAAAELTERDDVRAVVLWGGERVFAAGNDVKEMADLTYSDMVKVSASVSSATTAIARIPKPVVAAVNGYALGGGCELALAADLRFAAEDAVLGQPEVLLGIIPGAGGTQRLARLVGASRAKDIIFTGRFVKADEALRIGMVDRVVPADRVLEESVAWAAQFSGAASLAIRAAKECIDRGSEVDLDTGLEIERQQFAGVFATEDRTRGITSFVENGPGKATFVGR
jgi:enoyl-CoA hydratase/carnithine racemase